MSALFPVTTVGSWSRTLPLLTALRKRQAGEISEETFQEAADEAVLECLRLQDEAGVDIVTDGELRRDNFYSFVAEKLDGCRLMTMSELMDYIPDRARFEEILRAADVPAFAMKNPVVFDKIKVSGSGLSVDEAEFLKANTDKPIKIPLPGPFHLTRAAWFPGISKDAYPTREDLAADIVAVLRQEIIALRDLGVAFVQLDEPTLTQVVYG
ncbi:MAG: vitamin-B12 independent methionine synthase, partial [Acidimicrobiia bacterium]